MFFIFTLATNGYCDLQERDRLSDSQWYTMTDTMIQKMRYTTRPIKIEFNQGCKSTSECDVSVKRKLYIFDLTDVINR